MSGMMFSFKGGVLVVRHKASRQIVFHVKDRSPCKRWVWHFSFYTMQCSLPTHDGRDHMEKYYSLMSAVPVFWNRVVHPKRILTTKWQGKHRGSDQSLLVSLLGQVCRIVSAARDHPKYESRSWSSTYCLQLIEVNNWISYRMIHKHKWNCQQT